MATITLHYIYDPLCGWCYGAAPLVQAARAVVAVRPHGGGMMSDSHRHRVTPQLRDYVMPHDRRIAQLTGQPFGDAYANGLLRDTTAVFDSTPPIAAMLAAEEIGGRGLDLLSRLQRAHYVEGRRIADREVLIEIAGAIDLDRAAFAPAFDEMAGAKVRTHIAETRRLMSRVGAQGFPAFALEHDGDLTLIDVGEFFGRPEKLRQWLQKRVPGSDHAEPRAAGEFGCGPESCLI